MRTIALSADNAIQNGKNSSFIYKFPNSVVFDDEEVAVASLNLFYSWNNISAELGNNTFQYSWSADGTTFQNFTVALPDGLWEIDTINKYLEYTFIQNGHYLKSGNDNVYYAKFSVNATYYSIQLDTFPVPTSLGSLTNPANMTLPTTSFNPSIILSTSSKFYEVIGFASNFASSTTPTTASYLSTTSPQVQKNSNVLVSCSNINNIYANPSTIIYSFSPNTAIGGQIVEKPPQLQWNKLSTGTYNELRIDFLGTNFQQLSIRDPQISILLCIKSAKSPY